MQLYSVVGPTIALEPYFGFTGDLGLRGSASGAHPWYDWELSAGIRGVASIKADILDRFVLEYSFELFDVSRILAQDHDEWTVDADGDGVPDSSDGCPNDPNKTTPGDCGCNNPETPSCGPCPDGDADGDGVCNSADDCRNDPNKTAPGICGCGIPDTDSDGDGTPDCNDGCPNDPNKTTPGDCGCGNPETSECIPGELAPPTGVAASDGTYTGKVAVAWDAASGAEGYEVLRNTSNNSSGAIKIATTVASLMTIDDEDVIPGDIYWYWVRSKKYNPLLLSDFSAPDDGYADSTVALEPPTSVSASDGTYTGKVVVAWDAASGAEGYEVLRNTSNNSSGAIKIATTAASLRTIDDEDVIPGDIYWYWVRSKKYNPILLSGFSSPDSGYAPEGVALHGSGLFNVIIPDPTPHQFCGDPVEVTLDLDGAPPGATVTKVKVYYKIDHTYVGDLRVQLWTRKPNGNKQTYTLWDPQGGSSDNLREIVDDIHTFDGFNPNQTWYLWAEDCEEGDRGTIRYFEIWVDYE